LSLTRLVLTVVLGSLAVTLALYTLEPPLGVITGVIACGLLIGTPLGKPRVAFTAGLVAGSLGFLIAYSLGGGGFLSLAVYRELLGPIGPLVPLAYYMLSCGTLSAIAATILPYSRLARHVTLRKHA